MNQRLKADGALMIVALAWGSTFVMVKDALQDTGPFLFLGVRFTLASLFLLLAAPRRATGDLKSNILPGITLGLFLSAGYALQTIGLQFTTASKAAFITGLNVVIVPLGAAVVLKKTPKPAAVLGAVLAAFGLSLLSLSPAESPAALRQGDFLVLLCAFAFAAHILGVGVYSAGRDPVSLAFLQTATVGVLTLILALVLERPFEPLTARVWTAIAVTGLFATSLAFFLQAWAQKKTPPTHAALILTMEPVFGALFGYLLLNESLTGAGLAGAGLILAGMILAELPVPKGLSRPAGRS